MRVLFVGLGNLGSQVFDLLVLRAKKGDQFLVGGRNLDYLGERTRWTAASALQLGTIVEVETTYMDVRHIDRTAETIAKFQPDIIFSSVTTLPSASISQLPPSYFKTLAQACGGPWLPTTLEVVYKLMQAVKQTGLEIIVLNGGTPDNSHEVLSKVGLAPTSGIGNIALTVPPMRQAIAAQIHQPVDRVEVLFFAHSYVVQSLRTGTTGGAPFHLSAFAGGEDVTSQLDLPALFNALPATLEHEYTQLLTAASAAMVFDTLTAGISTVVHAPGPNGLPGGYPVQGNKQGLGVVLPPGLTLDEAIRVNQGGQRLDGIERIGDDGTVYFAERNMAILKETLGYECKHMLLSEVEQWSTELKAKYDEIARM
jgi:hypothetical protein